MNSSAAATDVPETPILWDLFHGEVTSLSTTVYVRVIGDFGSDCRLRGTVRGPYSSASQTLPANFQLTDCGPGETLLAKACVTDPCAWSPLVPASYRVRLEVLRDHQVIHELTSDFGIRDLITRGRSLKLSGQRVVLRGVDRRHASSESIELWHRHNAVILADEPDTLLCRQAAEQGVLICARLTGAVRIGARLRRIASCPCIGVVWINDATLDKKLKQVAPNVLLAANAEDAANRENSDVIFWQVGSDIAVDPFEFGKPIIAVRPLLLRAPLADARAACDVLQRDLAPRYDLAGYFV